MYGRYFDSSSAQKRSSVAIRPRKRPEAAPAASKPTFYFPEQQEVELGSFQSRESYVKKRFRKHRPETPNILTEKQVRRIRNRILKIYQSSNTSKVGRARKKIKSKKSKLKLIKKKVTFPNFDRFEYELCLT